MDERIRKGKNSEQPTAFPNEAAEVEEINRRAVAVLNYANGEPLDVHFLIDETASPRLMARASARKALRELYLHIVGSDYYSPTQPLALSPVPPSKQMEIINQPEENAADIGWAFHDMKKLTNWSVDPFDIRAANQWCRQHKSICDSSASLPPGQLP